MNPPTGNPLSEGERMAVTWTQAVATIVQKCEVAAAFNQRAVFNAVGARALGKLLTDMASKLDQVIAWQDEDT